MGKLPNQNLSEMKYVFCFENVCKSSPLMYICLTVMNALIKQTTFGELISDKTARVPLLALHNATFL